MSRNVVDFNYFDETGVGAIFGDVPDLTLPSGARHGVNIFEAAGDSMGVAEFGEQQLRSAAMGAALAWASEGNFTYEDMNAAVFVMADADGDEELSDEEEAFVGELFQGVANALLTMGADSEDVESFLDDEDDEAGARIGAAVSGKLDASDSDDETLIAKYAVSGDMVLEATIKVVRGGKVVLKKKRVGRPKKMSSAQKAALKKARMKAFTGAAKLARKKAMKMRTKRGL